MNDVLKNHILGCKASEKQCLLEKLEFLANGIWDAGVRVKKLKGLSRKTIFEARLSLGRRILFAFGKHQGRIAIYLWGIAFLDDFKRPGRLHRAAKRPLSALRSGEHGGKARASCG